MVVKSGAGDYDLVIRNVTAADAGQYICIEDLGFGARHVNELVVSGNFFYLFIVIEVRRGRVDGAGLVIARS